MFSNSGHCFGPVQVLGCKVSISYSEEPDSIVFNIRVIPRASKSEVVGEFDGSLKVKIAAPPVDGAANEEVVKLIAKSFGRSRAEVEILSGHTSRTKRLRIRGGSAKRLLELAGR
jgi:uncharacterized protein